MCGIAGIAGPAWQPEQLHAMLSSQQHRGPDDRGTYFDPDKKACLGHNRLSILDLSCAGHQPMSDPSGRYHIAFNGEVYNYLEIRTQLESEFRFSTQTDTEVILYAYIKWGEACLDRFIGMFAIAIWDEREKVLWAARDRFGVKPFHYAFDQDGNFYFASEIKALHTAGIPQSPNESVWAAYLAYGRYDHDENTFWTGIKKLLPGHFMRWKDGNFRTGQWYSLHERTGDELDPRSIEEVTDEYLALMQDNVKLRFRADVPVAINISGGLDSSALLSIVDQVQGKDAQVKAFSFYTGDDRYDELPWVQEMISRTRHELVPCLLQAADVPALAESVQRHQDEPFGGVPTLAYARLFEIARSMGIIVLLDGQGMDEQWAGYDYYRKAATDLSTPTVQGTSDSPVVADALSEGFLAQASAWQPPSVYSDKLRNLQYRDAFYTKIPRALRFNDRISMRASTELREPFLDHRLFEIAFRQRPEYKIQGDTGKYFMRRLLQTRLPGNIVEAPKRPLQTPQREWLREDLRDWTYDLVNTACNGFASSWLKKDAVMNKLDQFMQGKSDNSFFVWQWISIAMLFDQKTRNTFNTEQMPSQHLPTFTTSER